MPTTNPYRDKTSPWSSHALIAAALVKLPAGSRVLDVGAASGTIARMCQDKGLDFYGIEPHPAWAESAAPFYRKLWIGTVESFLAEDPGRFDAVVFGDVLEHTPDPAAILAAFVRTQPEGCRFIISVPNVAHLWVRLNLLLGRFNYAERGILDRTHLRFFTRQTVIQLIREAGLQIDNLTVTPVPLELIAPFFMGAFGIHLFRVFAWITRLFPTLLGYQFVVTATKPPHDAMI